MAKLCWEDDSPTYRRKSHRYWSRFDTGTHLISPSSTREGWHTSIECPWILWEGTGSWWPVDLKVNMYSKKKEPVESRWFEHSHASISSRPTLGHPPSPGLKKKIPWLEACTRQDTIEVTFTIQYCKLSPIIGSARNDSRGQYCNGTPVLPYPCSYLMFSLP